MRFAPFFILAIFGYFFIIIPLIYLIDFIFIKDGITFGSLRNNAIGFFLALLFIYFILYRRKKKTKQK
ncbi:hypothetical protein AQ616_07630 [Oceanobacillus sp. E9]|uniref:hypothetical protein n=1 Tax=Oceanobacillus TaxID=182709 RepID=UPI000347B5C0|nr:MULTISPECIES: hypothetical protein [Oceanobacillus]OEH54910.1 hypothetical protein AQ616_07630 [Oceanobacillus sp. E9]